MDLSQNLSSEAFLTNKFGDRYLYSINRSVFNHSGSQAMYQKRFPDLLGKEEFLHILVGTDSGLFLQHIKSKRIPSGSKILCIELPEILSRLKDEGALQNLDERVQCISLSELTQAEEDSKFRMDDYFMLGQVDLRLSFAVSDAFIPEYRELVWNVQQIFEKKKWSIVTGLDRELFIRTQLMNVAENRFSVAVFNRVFIGKTAVLLGGGPSLDAALSWIQRNREKVVVLAVSRISRRLCEVGLVPDFVFSIDPQVVSFEVSKEMLKFNQGTIFINGYHVSPHLLAQWNGVSLYSGPLFPWNTPLNIAKDFPHPGPTVTNTAFATAVEMGFSQIILAGVDLCFDSEGNSHALGSVERSAAPQFSQQQYWVKTNCGKDAVTTYAMGNAVTILGAQVKQAMERGCKTLNSSLDAAEIPNVEYLSVKDIENGLLPADTEEALAKTWQNDIWEQRIEHYEKVISELLRAQTKFKQIKKLSNDALKYNDGLFGRKGKKADFKYKIKMDNLEKKLNRSYADFMPLVQSFDLKKIIKITHIKESTEWTDKEIEDAGRLYYESLRNSSECLIDLVIDAVERTRSRLEEEQAAPDFSQIFRQWRKDNIPGRAGIWQTRSLQRGICLSTKDKKTMADFTAEFVAILSKKEIHSVQQQSENANLSVARGNALLFFRNHNFEGLNQIISSLNLLDSDESGRVAHLVNGYLAELDDNQEAALNEYQGVIADDIDPVLEDALRRISILALKGNDFENAGMALQCLASISPVYIPQYAEISKLMGNVQQAVNLYADYLEQVPNDTNIMLKLGIIYKEQGIYEGAEMMFKAVLELNSENSAAERLLAELRGNL